MPEAPDNTASLAGKYLTFALGDEEYGLPILKVREIIGYMDVTAVPGTPGHVKGVINLRGQVIGVADLRDKFGMMPVPRTEETCIIVVEAGGGDGARPVSTGLIVDRVSEVLDIRAEQLAPPPSMGGGIDASAILALAKVEGEGGGVKILLDIDIVLGVAAAEPMLMAA